MKTFRKTYSCIVVDDDELDRLMLISFVKRIPFLQIDKDFGSPTNAFNFCEKFRPDIVFLDIDMPGINGIDLRKKIGDESLCIFISAYPEYALESYEVDALDFILKPLKFDRFALSMKRLGSFLEIKNKAELMDHTLGDDSLFIKEGHDLIKLKISEIEYLEALKDYTQLITPTGKYSVLRNLGSLLEEKSFQSFIRIHRSYAVQKHYIQRLAPKELFVNNTSLPIGRTFRKSIESLLNPGNQV